MAGSLLLDLHNIFANALNGRQTVDDFLSQVPRYRVWEIHLAGGFEMDGLWLDAHSGAIPDHPLAIARRVIPALPNLKAIIFEICGENGSYHWFRDSRDVIYADDGSPRAIAGMLSAIISG